MTEHAFPADSYHRWADDRDIVAEVGPDAYSAHWLGNVARARRGRPGT